jgi:membrane protease YdiL (CAAX protease family)
MKPQPFEKTYMLCPTRKERLTASPAVVLFFFLVVMSLAQLGRSRIGNLAARALPESAGNIPRLLILLFATTVTVAAVLLWCLPVERRTLSSLGFVPRGGMAEYGIGLVFGFILFGGAVLICMATNSLTLTASEKALPIGAFLLCLLGFLIQGMSEEMLCRSYLMVSLSRGLPLWACAVINALLFSLLHVGNPGVSIIALVNIFLFGLFASGLTLRRGSIWMVGALHSMWNFAQGNLFGIPVSGLAGLPSPLRAEIAEGTWQTLVNGGAFGLEGGLAVTGILAGACVILLFLPTKKSEVVSVASEDS